MGERADLDFITQRVGHRPIVVVAPHGGRRERALKRGDGINDLHTADIALELAERLDAFAIVNHALDRNDIDLNRISELAERAPGVLALLREAVSLASAGGRVPLVLLVHGWNVSSLHCDIGIGLREVDGEMSGAHPTISRETLDSFVVPLRDELERCGLRGLVGLRYPASAADNATQIFSGRHIAHAHEDVAHLSSLAAAGLVEAVQLELSITLRWPGRHRDGVLEALIAAAELHLEASQARASTRGALVARDRAGWPAPRAREKTSELPEGEKGEQAFVGESIQGVLADGSGVFMAVEPIDRRSLAARVCIARPDGHLALFVCEAPRSAARSGRIEAGGLSWELGGTVRFAGPTVLYPTNDAFLDLEEGLRGATLAHIELEIGTGGVDERAAGTGSYVRIDEATVEVPGPVLRRVGGRLGGGPPPFARVYLVAPELAEPLLIEQRGEGGAARVSFTADGRALAALHPSAGELRGTVIVRVPVFRPTPDGRVLKIVFGVAELDWRGRAGLRHALFETVEVLALSA